MSVHEERDITAYMFVCLSATLWYCIEMNAYIAKLFPPSGRDTTRVFSTPTAVTKFPQKNTKTHSGGVKYTGWEKFAIFEQKSPFVLETIEDRSILTMEH